MHRDALINESSEHIDNNPIEKTIEIMTKLMEEKKESISEEKDEESKGNPTTKKPT